MPFLSSMNEFSLYPKTIPSIIDWLTDWLFIIHNTIIMSSIMNTAPPVVPVLETCATAAGSVRLVVDERRTKAAKCIAWKTQCWWICEGGFVRVEPSAMAQDIPCFVYEITNMLHSLKCPTERRLDHHSYNDSCNMNRIVCCAHPQDPYFYIIMTGL